MLLPPLACPSGGLKRRFANNVHVTGMSYSHFFLSLYTIKRRERCYLDEVGLLLVAPPVLVVAHGGH